MKVKINDKLICIPPHVSTTWERVAFMQTEEGNETTLTLILHLLDGNIIKIPDLDTSIIDIAFAAHLKHLEKKGESKSSGAAQNSFDQTGAVPIRFGIAGLPGNFEALESTFQHNPAQSHTSDLPKEVIEKIVGITKLMTNGEVSGIPKPEPHCNCIHCQIARAIHELDHDESRELDEPITEEDLQFRTWDITQIGEKLYTVSNLTGEQYNVYLGSPVGCTCGSRDCEHVKAVLYS